MRIILPQYHVAWGYLFSEYAKEICKSAFLLWTDIGKDQGNYCLLVAYYYLFQKLKKIKNNVL